MSEGERRRLWSSTSALCEAQARRRRRWATRAPPRGRRALPSAPLSSSSSANRGCVWVRGSGAEASVSSSSRRSPGGPTACTPPPPERPRGLWGRVRSRRAFAGGAAAAAATAAPPPPFGGFPAPLPPAAPGGAGRSAGAAPPRKEPLSASVSSFSRRTRAGRLSSLLTTQAAGAPRESERGPRRSRRRANERGRLPLVREGRGRGSGRGLLAHFRGLDSA